MSANSQSKLKFGTDAVAPAARAVSTPLLSGTPDTFYFLNLEAVSVGNRRIPNSYQGPPGSAGNIIIDSGTTITMIESTFYNELEEAVRESIAVTPAGRYGHYNLCYEANSIESLPETTMVFHFSGADVSLKKVNMFRELGSVACLAILPTNKYNIYGNVAQVDFQVHYDLTKKQLSFAPADCTQY